MKRFALGLVVVASVATFAPRSARADLELDIENPRVFSIQERPYRLGHEFTLGVGLLPLDAFYIGSVVSGSYTYHFSDFWAWEMLHGNFSLNADTGLEDELLEDFEVEPVRGGGDRITVFGTSALVIKPLFGKLALFNDTMLYAESSFMVGGGPMQLELEDDGTFYFAGLIGGAIRFWTSEVFSIKFEIRDYLIFRDWTPDNALMLGVTASFNFFTPSAEELAARGSGGSP
ncbi:MAG: outer membrane beta-barrel domain-containing protein [Myxococcota bacterium]